MTLPHVIEHVREIIDEEGPMSAGDIASRLAERGAAVSVISPDSIEQYERDGETVMLVRGGSHRALSADALEGRMRRRMSGLRKRGDGKWITVDVAEEELGGMA